MTALHKRVSQGNAVQKVLNILDSKLRGEREESIGRRGVIHIHRDSLGNSYEYRRLEIAKTEGVWHSLGLSQQ